MAARPTLILGLLFALYTCGYLIYYPSVFAVADEAYYVEEAVALASGHATVARRDPVTRTEVRAIPSDYPLGTSALQAPLVWLGGFRAARVLSWLSLGVLLLSTARLLAHAGLSPLFAALVLAFPPSLVLGRVAMSDLPGAAVVAAGLVAVFEERYLLAGALAGLTLLFRETSVLPFIPFLALAPRRWLITFAAAAGLRLLAAALAFGDAFHVRAHGYGFSLSALSSTLPLYVFSLLVLVPGGLVGVALYRGPRRRELQLSVLLGLCFLSLYSYTASESTFAKRIILAPRYLLPWLPLLALACGEVATRIGGSAPVLPPRLRSRAAVAALAAVAVAAISVHPMMARWEAPQRAIVEAIYSKTPPGAVLVTDEIATMKFISPAYGPRTPITTVDLSLSRLKLVVGRNPDVYFVLVERSDSEFFRTDWARNAAFVSEVRNQCAVEPVYDQVHSPTDRLLIARIRSCDLGRAQSRPLSRL